MANNVRLDAMRTAIRQRTHYETSQFVTDAELNGMINDSVKELWDLLTTAYEGYSVSTADNAIASGNTFNVPSDFYKLLGVDLLVSSPYYQTLPRVGWSDRNSGRRGYELRGSTVLITPYAWAAGNTFRLSYIPVPTTLAADADTFDAIDGWHEYPIADVCIKICGKDKSDPALFVAQKQMLTSRIESGAHNRDANEPPHVADVRSVAGNGALIGGRMLYDLD